jgi:hypothetical protein
VIPVISSVSWLIPSVMNSQAADVEVARRRIQRERVEPSGAIAVSPLRQTKAALRTAPLPTEQDVLKVRALHRCQRQVRHFNPTTGFRDQADALFLA